MKKKNGAVARVHSMLKLIKTSNLWTIFGKSRQFWERPHISDEKKTPSFLLEPIFWRTSLYPLVPYGPCSRADLFYGKVKFGNLRLVYMKK